MKIALAIAFCLNAHAAMACNPLQAIENYYGGNGEIVSVRQVSGDVYAISLSDPSEQAQCKGGLAKVNAQCELSVLRALYCERK